MTLSKWRIRPIRNGKFEVVWPEGHTCLPFNSIAEAMEFIGPFR